MSSTTKTDMTVANTIVAQIGGKAFVMMGTRYKTGDASSLSFDVRGTRLCTHVRVTLDATDTYTVTFTKCRNFDAREVAKVVGVYAESLKQTIEDGTGLRLGL